VLLSDAPGGFAGLEVISIAVTAAAVAEMRRRRCALSGRESWRQACQQTRKDRSEDV
jgi:hypothetical protein